MKKNEKKFFTFLILIFIGIIIFMFINRDNPILVEQDANRLVIIGNMKSWSGEIKNYIGNEYDKDKSGLLNVNTLLAGISENIGFPHSKKRYYKLTLIAKKDSGELRGWRIQYLPKKNDKDYRFDDLIPTITHIYLGKSMICSGPFSIKFSPYISAEISKKEWRQKMDQEQRFRILTNQN